MTPTRTISACPHYLIRHHWGCQQILLSCLHPPASQQPALSMSLALRRCFSHTGDFDLTIQLWYHKLFPQQKSSSEMICVLFPGTLGLHPRRPLLTHDTHTKCDYLRRLFLNQGELKKANIVIPLPFRSSRCHPCPVGPNTSFPNPSFGGWGNIVFLLMDPH